MCVSHFYLEKGRGEPLILLHGNGGSSDYFRGQIDGFARWYHVYALDTRGHGKTPRGSLPFTIRQFADDLRCFMDSRGIEKAHLLGFSDGANVALVFAIRCPERVDRLILNGANLSPAGVKRSVQLPIELGYRIAKRFSLRSESAGRHGEMLGLMVNEPMIAPEELALIRSRTLVIAGTQDLIRRSHTELIARSIPDSRLAYIKGNHFIAAKNPADFNRAVLDFLREQ